MQMVIKKAIGDFIVFPVWDRDGNEVLKVKFNGKEYDAFLTLMQNMHLLRVKGLLLNEKNVALSLTKEQYESARKMLQDFKAEYFDRFKNNEFSVTLKWRQEINDYDYPTLLLDKWSLSYDSKIELKKLSQNVSDADKIRDYASKKGLLKSEKRVYQGWSTVEATDYVLELTYDILEKAKLHVTDEEKVKLMKEKDSINKLLEDEKSLLRKIFTDLVHVNEDGYFSDCPRYCDDCIWLRHIKRDYIDLVQNIAKKFYVRSWRGKVYTYYSADDDVLQHLSKECADIVEEEKEELKKRLQEIDYLLSIN